MKLDRLLQNAGSAVSRMPAKFGRHGLRRAQSSRGRPYVGALTEFSKLHLEQTTERIHHANFAILRTA